MIVTLDKKVADFTAASTGGDVQLSKLNGEFVVLYFYPKDNTPGCTTEGIDFAESHARFKRAGAVIFDEISRCRPFSRAQPAIRQSVLS